MRPADGRGEERERRRPGRSGRARTGLIEHRDAGEADGHPDGGDATRGARRRRRGRGGRPRAGCSRSRSPRRPTGTRLLRPRDAAVADPEHEHARQQRAKPHCVRSGRAGRPAPPTSRASRVEDRARDEEPRPCHQQRRQRLDRERDPEVGRAPDDVDDRRGRRRPPPPCGGRLGPRPRRGRGREAGVGAPAQCERPDQEQEDDEDECAHDPSHGCRLPIRATSGIVWCRSWNLIGGSASNCGISPRSRRSRRRGSFGRAAQRLGYTQSAVSQQIATLERIVGERLLDRPGGPRPVSLTEAGELLLRHARGDRRPARGGPGRLRRAGRGRGRDAPGRDVPVHRPARPADADAPLPRRRGRASSSGSRR